MDLLCNPCNLALDFAAFAAFEALVLDLDFARQRAECSPRVIRPQSDYIYGFHATLMVGTLTKRSP